jgi:HNH endonuclease
MSKAYIAKAVRKRVTTQSRHRCGYCLTQERVVGTPMEIDHVIPEALGGQTAEDNLGGGSVSSRPDPAGWRQGIVSCAAIGRLSQPGIVAVMLSEWHAIRHLRTPPL